MKLADIHRNYDTDKGTSHSYIDIYDTLFESMQNQEIVLLEIGALTCGSLKMFEHYFQTGTIYGIDNWAQTSENTVSGFRNQSYKLGDLIEDINTNHSRIKLITCDSTNTEQVNQQVGSLTFNIIIDDGDHKVESQFATYCNFIRYLEPGGIYIVEDVDKYHILQNQILNYNQTHGLKLDVETKALFKNHRPDDVLLIIR